MNERILLLDDDPSVHEIARPYLERDGYIVYSAITGRDGLALLAERDPSLLILDVVLPDMLGTELLEQLRRTSQVPTLMLSGRAAVDERIEGLSRGADDYLTKPFSPREMIMRVRALLRRGKSTPSPRVMRFDAGRLEIDAVRHEVRVDGAVCGVTASEYNLLEALAGYPGRVYSRTELAYRARGEDFAGYERTIDAHVKNLRRKIGDDSARPRYVETVRGVGYRLNAEPT